MKEHKKIRKTAVFRSFISCLVPELQSFEDTRNKAKSADKKQGNQLKSSKSVTESVSRTIEILKQLFTEFHSLFVCTVSVGSDS